MGGVFSYVTNPGDADEVTAANNLADNAIIRGDGGGKGVQDSGIFIDDSDNVTGMGSLDSTGDVTVSRSEVAGDVVIELENTDNTSSVSNATMKITAGGLSGGDPSIVYSVPGGNTWAIGIDNSSSNNFTIAKAPTFGASTVIAISPGTPSLMTMVGNVTFSTSSTSAVYCNVTNSSTSSTADAQFDMVVGGASGGDCKITMSVTGVAGVQWYVGLDNSDDDSFVIGEGSTFGGDNNIRIDNDGIFQFKKGVSHNLTTTATDYNVLVTDYFIGVTDNSVARTITLPSTAVTGQTFTVKDQAGTAGGTPITIDTAGAETIDGAATATINANYGSISVYFDGTNYFIT